MKKRIVITGLGLVTSIGIGKDDFWKALISGKSGISEIDSFDTSEHTTHFGGQVKNFKAEMFLDRRKIKAMARASHLAIAATKLAIEDANIGLKKRNTNKVAVMFGTTGGEIQEMEKMDIIWLKQGKEAVGLKSIVQYPVNNISANVAKELKLKGFNRMFTTACAAGNYALGYGLDLMRLGKTDIAVVGGSDAFSYLSFTGFNQVRAVAPLKCQPFDKNRKGMIPGEGSGVLILETLESAMERKANIYAEVLGYGLSCDAYHMTQPNVEGVSKCMQKALDDSGIKPEEVDYIC
ncbi:MAG: beta-ketoacyl-[acyl-carrier-protein] synthase family protein, partial [Candidatus Omnitrophica bacterium]|nr:beta-ketoacyl-[acyl-carrier-protein] synthase family protein [Candidatus Omnitrophota bacterium]